MNYIVEYEICALLFLIIVTIRFNTIPKFQNKQNSLFGFILYCGITNLSLDIIGSYLVEYADSFPIWLNVTVNSIFFMIQVLFPALLLIYVYILSGRKVTYKTHLLLIPAYIFELILIINLFNGCVFYFKEVNESLEYTHGPLFFIIMFGSVFYFAITIYYIIKHNKLFRKVEKTMISSFILVILLSLLIQYFYPRLLLTGVAISISIFMMFLTMQNPEVLIDPITGAYNYSAFYEYLRGKIVENKGLWVTAVDVGEIRRVNSTMGVHVGNDLLTQVNAYISNLGKSKIKIFRVIGTRFVIVTNDEIINKKIIDELTIRFKKPWYFNNTKIMLLATIRYCDECNKFSSSQEIIDLIDLAYSKASEEGYGTTRPIISERLKQLHRTEQIQEALRNSLNTKTNFYMNYQPIYSVKDNKFCGAEALLRFKDEKLGNVSPAEFIPIAEACGLIQEIDELVIKMSCDYLKSHLELIDNGLEIFEINLSASEFNHNINKLYKTVIDNIKGIEKYICFEVTETAITNKRDILLSFMNQLINDNVRFAIDDFGTGYANILQLVKLPFAVVKLDKIFVTQNSGKEALMLKDLIKMFTHMGLSTVFEGIETKEQSEFATSLGVEHIQGYYYSKPIDENNLNKVMGK